MTRVMGLEHTGQKDASCLQWVKAKWYEDFITLLNMALIENKLSTSGIFYLITSDSG